ncbi:H-NS family nucleoid-associated regulatory protein [Muricoccus vinaceus]|uniref:H-NS family nucleoid-associated regulatory protein n=1 Tax=Muricoccus vinaceus TaxID=424704 RepID=A0ABV6IT18_9PROT
MAGHRAATALVGQRGRAGVPPRTNVRKPRSDLGQKVAAKYRGPDGGTWSGRGRKPGWLTQLEAQGRHQSEFAV